MVTQCKVDILVTNDLRSFLKKNNCSGTQFELLRFIGRHPNAKLSFSVIASAMGDATADLAKALMSLIEKDILSAQSDEYGLTTYSLSDDRQVYSYICYLANLQWSEAVNLKNQVKRDLDGL
jgi:hypothetical protein